jgi:hypothetical protein
VGVFPDVVPMRVKVRDVGLDEEQQFDTRIAYDEDFLPQIGAAMAYASIGKVSDTKGESTAIVDFTIRTTAMPDGKFKRNNMFYGVNDVGKIAVQELTQALMTICGDTDKESDIIEVQVDIQMEPERRTASLVSAVPDKVKVKPGEIVNFTTTIKPYRKEKETLTIPFKVPQNWRDGLLPLDIKGGGLVALTQMALLQQSGIAVVSDEEKNMTTADKLKMLAKSDKNNEIVFVPSVNPAVDGKKVSVSAKVPAASPSSKKIALLGKDKEEAGRENKFATDYVIDNVIHAALQVESDKD